MTADGDGTRRADGVRTHPSRKPRLLAVCAVLLGLFFMHGAPASAAEGCHDASTAPMGMASVSTATATTMAPMSAEPPQAAAAHHAPSATVSHGAAATCWATPARGRAPLGGWAVVVLAVLPLLGAGLAARVPWRVGGGRRGPPSGGRAVLLRVCVART